MSSHQFTETDDTQLGRETALLTEPHGGLSGFQLQSDGLEALASRLVLADLAERSIDVQYYLITDDQVGLVFLDSLLRAADRGVRVRVLLDDILTGGYDKAMVALDSHPNFEVRIFNPFTSRGSRVRDGLFDFARVNRRMHNKSFTIDNQVTIIGGRNIADEYFAAHHSQNFGDADVLCVGSVVGEVSSMFDEYWNSRWAAPLEMFAKMPADPAAKLVEVREHLVKNRRAVADSVYGYAVRQDGYRFLTEQRGDFHWAPHELVVDPLSKTEGKDFTVHDGIVGRLAEVVAKAEHDLVVVSPYFVPLQTGVEYFQSLIDRGLRVRVVTNSLAANNHGIVHSGYIPYRKALLRMGVELYEVRGNADILGVDRGGSGAALATLHTKAFLVDHDVLFLGSFNWDPRSALLNTEMGIVIHSPDVADSAWGMLDRGLGRSCYRLELDERDKVRWVDESGDEPVVWTHEPEVGWWRRTMVNLGRLLPIRGQL
jgi:putative cardiolipin synthase